MWSGGMHRIRLGAVWRSPGAVQTEGANKRAFWSSSRRLLAVIVGFACTGRRLVSGVCRRCGHMSTCLAEMKPQTLACQPAKTAMVLTAQTHSNVLQYYGVRTSKADAVPAAAAGSGAAGVVSVKRLDVFLERSIVIEGSALCMDIVGDSRALVLGMADGSLRTYSWHAQV